MTEDSNNPEQPQRSADTPAFRQRRTRQRIADLLAFIGIGGTLVFAISGNQLGVPYLNSYCYSVIIFFGVLLAIVVFTQVNWRCPVCNKSLAGPRARIDSFFTPEPLNCPHCGTKLL
jgi:hypothetical protein